MRSRVDALEQKLFRFFQRGQGQIARDRREARQEIFQSFAALQVIEQGLDGHAGASEDRNAVHRLGVASDRLRHVFIVAQSLRDCAVSRRVQSSHLTLHAGNAPGRCSAI